MLVHRIWFDSRTEWITSNKVYVDMSHLYMREHISKCYTNRMRVDCTLILPCCLLTLTSLCDARDSVVMRLVLCLYDAHS